MTILTPDETLLGLLASHPQHGYQLLDAFHDPGQLGNIWHLSTSQLYAVLKRLQRQGWIEGRQIESDSAPTRTEYVISPAGRAQLDAWLYLSTPSPSIRRVRVEFLSRLYVARLLNLPTLVIIERQRAACYAERERLARRNAPTTAGVSGLSVDLLIAQLDAILGWLERCESVSHR